ncbi:hypothetical protein [Streptomyces sp. NPDC059918]|uniref:hypothetical protein n=1 Tax=unclassified Streptomyces TaxID=2593676 RepID=UPI0036470508
MTIRALALDGLKTVTERFDAEAPTDPDLVEAQELHRGLQTLLESTGTAADLLGFLEGNHQALGRHGMLRAGLALAAAVFEEEGDPARAAKIRKHMAQT